MNRSMCVSLGVKRRVGSTSGRMERASVLHPSLIDERMHEEHLPQRSVVWLKELAPVTSLKQHLVGREPLRKGVAGCC